MLRQVIAIFAVVLCVRAAHAVDAEAQLAAHGFALLAHTAGAPPQAVVAGATCDVLEAAPPGLGPSLPVARGRDFDLGVLPPGCRFRTGIALDALPGSEERCGARFVVLVAADGANPEIIVEATLTYHDQADATPPWTPLEADLARYAGKTVRLRLETHDLQGAPAPNRAVPLWGDPIVYSTMPPDAPKLPSVLLLSIDTVRADRLGCYGYPRGTTPHLDALAGESYLFENALTPAPMTTPAHASVFNGVDPYRHRAGVYSEGFRLSTKWAPLAELLGQRGYRSAAFTEGIALAGSIGFSRGFQSYSDGISPQSHDRHQIMLTFQDARAWLRLYGHLPTFLFVHTYHVHDPYTAPDLILNRFMDPSYLGNPMAHAFEAKTPEEKRNASDCYDAGLAYADQEFGKFYEGLKQAGQLDDRWLIVFSDHGEEFWEHGGSGHARALYRESVHVPLLIRPPGGLSGGGRRIAKPVLITDLFATVLALTGTELPTGRDSMDLLAIAAEATPARETLHGFYRGYEFAKGDHGENREWETFSVRAPSYTYIATAPKYGGPVAEELFAPEDKAEQTNLAPEDPPQLEAGRRALQEQRKANGGGPRPPASGQALKEDELEALRGLGYF